MKIDTHHYDGLINHILNEWKIYFFNLKDASLNILD